MTVTNIQEAAEGWEDNKADSHVYKQPIHWQCDGHWHRGSWLLALSMYPRIWPILVHTSKDLWRSEYLWLSHLLMKDMKTTCRFNPKQILWWLERFWPHNAKANRTWKRQSFVSNRTRNHLTLSRTGPNQPSESNSETKTCLKRKIRWLYSKDKR